MAKGYSNLQEKSYFISTRRNISCQAFLYKITLLHFWCQVITMKLERDMPKKKTAHSVHKRQTHKPDALLCNLIGGVSLILIFDATVRIAFAIPLFTLSSGLMFHWRWLLIGIAEAILAVGIFRQKKWALWGLLTLSLVRVYTILSFPPVAILPPVERNLTLYLTKIITTAGAFYFFTKRKHFT